MNGSSKNSVTVIVPTYNRAHLLRETLPSYIQEHVCEVIVVNDGSVDNTESVIHSLQKDYPIIRYEKLPNNQGQCSAKNLGLSLATSSLVYFGDDDSKLLPGSIAELVTVREKTGATIVGARAIYMKSNETIHDALRRTQCGPDLVYDINHFKFRFDSDPGDVQEVPFTPACLLMETKLASDVGFDPVFKGNGFREETDFQIRCVESNGTVIFCPKAVQVNLPRVAATGGSWAKGILKYEYYSIKNNYIFWKRHYTYFKRQWGVRKSMFWIQSEFIVTERIPFIIKQWIKLLVGETLVRQIMGRGRVKG